jgi:general secretion pathway protein G
MFAGCSNPEEEARVLLNKAIALEQNDQFDEASAVLESVMEVYPQTIAATEATRELENVKRTLERLKTLQVMHWESARIDIARLSKAVEAHYLDTGVVPDSLNELVSNTNKVNGWNGPYVKVSTTKDPFGRDYVYRSPGEHGDFDIYTLGADGVSGGTGLNRDFNSWE